MDAISLIDQDDFVTLTMEFEPKAHCRKQCALGSRFSDKMENIQAFKYGASGKAQG